MDGLARIYIDEFGDFLNARRISDITLESDKQKTREFWLLRARIMRRYSGLTTSMECIDNALKEDATYADALKMKGDMLLEIGRVMGARDAYRAAFEIDPENFEVRDILSKLEKDINERLEYERMMYSGVDINRLIRDGFHVFQEMIPNPFLADQKTPVHDPGWDQPQDSRIMEFSFDNAPSDRPSVLIDLFDLLVSKRFQQAIDVIDTELKDHPGDTRLNLLKGTVLMMKGQYKSAQRIDDSFWQSPPSTLRDEMLQRDFNGIFVNIDDEIDFHNQKKHKMSGGVAHRRFGFSDLAPLQMSEDMLSGLMDFARSPTEKGFLTHLKPRILEEKTDDKVQRRIE